MSVDSVERESFWAVTSQLGNILYSDLDEQVVILTSAILVVPVEG